MGVHGLTTFLRENKRSLAKSAEFTTHYDSITTLVIDGWSFIYRLLNDSSLPWVYGGEYAKFAQLIIRVVEAWLAVGLKPLFVFDGPYPPAKFATAVSRLNQSQVQPSLLFFRTSAASRSSPRFLHEARIILPLIYTTCITSLKSFLEVHADALELHFADEEGDPYAVELAGRLGGYVAGQDSDFVVLNCEGYKGYIPLDEMVWITTSLGNVAPEDDGDFQTVKSKKKSNSRRSSAQGLLPPDSESVLSGLSLSVAIYEPTELAQHLKVPVTLLPLVGALVGNDFTLQFPSSSTSRSFHHTLFDRLLTPAQRIRHAASTLSGVLNPPPGSATHKRRHKMPQSVMELIAMTVAALAPGQTLSSVEQARITERIVDATLPYGIPKPPRTDAGEPVELWPTEACALHDPLACPLLAALTRPALEATTEAELIAGEEKEVVKLLYVRAYRQGNLSPHIMDALSTGTYWPELFLENPDIESVSRTVGRGIRLFAYALLDDGVGLPEREEPEDDASTATSQAGQMSEDGEDPDELIDVIEEDSDEEDSFQDVNNLRGALRGLQIEDTDAESVEEPPKSVSTTSVKQSVNKAPRKTIVTEYVRKGARVVAEEVEVPPLHSFLDADAIADESTSTKHSSPDDTSDAQSPSEPVQLQPADTRLAVFFRFLHTDTLAIQSLGLACRMPVLSVRWVVRCMHMRAAGGSKEREKERWTQREARACLAAFSCASSPAMHENVGKGESHTSPAHDPPVTIAERSIQLTAQISMALETIEHLVQILLLTDDIPPCASHFSGQRFHMLLAGMGEDATVEEEVWRATTEGLSDCFGVEVLSGRKAKKARKKERDGKSIPIPDRAVKPGQTIKRGSGIYGVLAQMDGDL